MHTTVITRFAHPTPDAKERRIVGLVLAELGRQRLAGRVDIADVLDGLVNQIEYPDERLTSAS
jgi:hypothetical protein